MGLWDKHPCDVSTLSGGQKQRAAIARAISERVVFLDAGLIAAEGTPEYIFAHRPTPAIRDFLSAAD